MIKWFDRNNREFFTNQNKNNRIMEALPPASFPRRVKRFQSLSMTPLDCSADTENDDQNLSISTSNKNIISTTNSVIMSRPKQQASNTITNQFSFKNRKRFFPNGNFHFKNTFRAQIETTKKENQNVTKTTAFLPNYKLKKLASSQIFDTQSIKSKAVPDRKSNQNSSITFKNEEKSNESQSVQDRNFQAAKRPHIPSFLLNKKRTPRESENSDLNGEILKELSESITLGHVQGRRGERCKTFNGPIIIKSTKSIQDNQNEEFSPPIQTIAYSKATASTLCTNLPRDQSLKTFKDFEQMQGLKEVSISMQQSQYGSKFKKEQSKDEKDIEEEIAQLFSEQEAQSEEFNQDLHNQLQKLF